MKDIQWKRFYFESSKCVGPIKSSLDWQKLVESHNGNINEVLLAKSETVPMTDPVTKQTSQIPSFGISPGRFGKEPTLGQWMKNNQMDKILGIEI